MKKFVCFLMTCLFMFMLSSLSSVSSYVGSDIALADSMAQQEVFTVASVDIVESTGDEQTAPAVETEKEEIVPQNLDIMSLLEQFLPNSVMLFVSVLIAFCASLATVLPSVTNQSSSFYKIVYAIVQFIGCNVGKAKNASDYR